MPAFRRGRRQSVAAAVALLREIGANHNTGPSQVAIRWLIENGSVLPIPGAKNGTQAAANAQALSITLALDEIEELDRVTREWRE